MDGAFTRNTPLAKPENYGSRAIPIADFRAFVAKEISRHNLRDGRRAKACRGRILAATFEESLNASGTLVRRATEMQRQYCLLAGEGITAKSTNREIALGQEPFRNRYWAEELIAHKGRKLMVRFDPDHLHDDIFVYMLDGRFIARAPCIEAVGFNDAEAARRHAQARKLFQRKQRELLDAERRLMASEVAALIPAPGNLPTALPKVVRLHPYQDAAMRGPSADEIDDAFSRGVSASFRSVTPFTPATRKRDG